MLHDIYLKSTLVLFFTKKEKRLSASLQTIQATLVMLVKTEVLLRKEGQVKLYRWSCCPVICLDVSNSVEYLNQRNVVSLMLFGSPGHKTSPENN